MMLVKVGVAGESHLLLPIWITLRLNGESLPIVADRPFTKVIGQVKAPVQTVSRDIIIRKTNRPLLLSISN